MKKKHPLRRVMMATVSTVSGVILLLALKPTSAPATTTAGLAAPPAAASAPAKGTSSAPSTSTGSKQTTAAAAAQTRTVTGTTVQTQYGPVQVQITVSGKKLTGTTLIQYPNNSGRSIQLAASSLPVLTKEAVAAQSAKIDAVSGASYTSAGYKKSLQSALDMAGI
jgi:uncharacterized protein with FMN-binding domain